jgi:antitoxin component YwqK of YwqJK toxin-antitoxin module
MRNLGLMLIFHSFVCHQNLSEQIYSMLRKIRPFHKLIIVLIVLSYIFITYHNKDEDLYYPNGQVKRTGEKHLNLNEGIWIWYFENGKKKLEGGFKQGKREGLWMAWDEEGNKVFENVYKNDMLNGYCRHFYPDGNIKSEGNYHNDQMDGKHFSYSPDGNIDTLITRN